MSTVRTLINIHQVKGGTFLPLVAGTLPHVPRGVPHGSFHAGSALRSHTAQVTVQQPCSNECQIRRAASSGDV